MRPESDDPILGARDDAELDAAVGDRVARAGARTEPPADDLATIRAAARESFRAAHGGARSLVRRLAPALAAVAALLVAAVGIGLWSRSGAPDLAAGEAPAAVGRVALVRGEVRVAGAPGTLGAGAPIVVGATVESAGDPGSRLAIRLDGGAELRLDAASRIRFESPSEVRLERGAVYFDSGFRAAGAPGPAFEVVTAAARFAHVGTQFEVRVGESADGATARLRVREGRVRFDGGLEASAGEEVAIDRYGRHERRTVAIHGAEWRWVAAVAPMPRTEGWSLVRFLDWLGRESGRRIEFADRRLEAEAGAARLHGGLAGLTPEEAAEVVLASAGLRARATDGVLRIEEAATPAP